LERADPGVRNHQAGNAVRIQDRVVEGDHSAHAMSDEVRSRHVKMVEETMQVLGHIR
jgi:hypothetical protein